MGEVGVVAGELRVELHVLHANDSTARCQDTHSTEQHTTAQNARTMSQSPHSDSGATRFLPGPRPRPHECARCAPEHAAQLRGANAPPRGISTPLSIACLPAAAPPRAVTGAITTGMMRTGGGNVHVTGNLPLKFTSHSEFGG